MLISDCIYSFEYSLIYSLTAFMYKVQLYEPVNYITVNSIKRQKDDVQSGGI